MSEQGNEKDYGRRGFFREGLRDMFKPLAEFLADRIKDVPDFSSLERGGLEEVFFIRPPGALREPDFLTACIRCGACKVACPYNVIGIVTREQAAVGRTYSWRPGRETGTPRIAPRAEPCRMCPDYPCAAACPCGALVLPRGPTKIGCAVWNEDTCLRSDGEDCRRCVQACPVGEAAIRIRRNGKVHVRPEDCTGCGHCEKACPVDPAAIQVYPPSTSPAP